MNNNKGRDVRIVSLPLEISSERSEEMFDANYFLARRVRDQVLPNVGLAMIIASPEVAWVVKTQEGEVG